jgi:hypothetical protein
MGPICKENLKKAELVQASQSQRFLVNLAAISGKAFLERILID